MQELNKVLHQPIRTQIMAYLATHKSCDYTMVKRLFNLSDGHMTTHMRELIGNGYVEAEKSLFDGKTKTSYIITPAGREAFNDYVTLLKQIISMP